MAMEILPEWVKVGTELVERGNRGAYGKTFKIAKVHKTGRFTIDEVFPTGVKNTQMFRVNGSWPNSRATSVGSSYSMRSRDLEVVTDEVRAAIADYRVYQRAIKIINDEAERLKGLISVLSQIEGNRDAVIAEARRIMTANEQNSAVT